MVQKCTDGWVFWYCARHYMLKYAYKRTLKCFSKMYRNIWRRRILRPGMAVGGGASSDGLKQMIQMYIFVDSIWCFLVKFGLLESRVKRVQTILRTNYCWVENYAPSSFHSMLLLVLKRVTHDEKLRPKRVSKTASNDMYRRVHNWLYFQHAHPSIHFWNYPITTESVTHFISRQEHVPRRPRSIVPCNSKRQWPRPHHFCVALFHCLCTLWWVLIEMNPSGAWK